MKKIISIVLAFTLALSLFACGGNQSTQAKVETETGEYIPTGDPIKDEPHWPIGEFGYHEPPEELRTYQEDPLTHKMTKNYRIPIHSDKYGDLELKYSTNGQRTLFKAGASADGKLLIISEDNPISIEQALEDLRIGDSIADNFGKKK